MGNNLAVRITADVADLQAKFAIARAEVSALSSEMNKLSRASLNGGLDAAASTRLQQVSSDYANAKVQVAALGSQLSQASAGVLGFSGRMAEAHGSISTATREFRALFDELSSGRTRQTPGTLAIIAQRVIGLGPAGLGAVAGVGALAAGLGYLAYAAVTAARAVSQIDVTSAFAGNLDITSTAIKRYVDDLSNASNVSRSDAQKIIAAFASIPGMSNAALATLSKTIADFAKETDQDSTKAAEGLAKLFSGNVSAAEFAKRFSDMTQLSQAQLNQARAADLSGNAAQVMAQKLTILDAAVSAAAPALKSMSLSFGDMAAESALVGEGIDVEQASVTVYNEQAAAIDKATAARKQFLALASQAAPTSDQTLKTGVSAAEGENPVAKQIEEAKSKIAEMNAALAIAKSTGDSIDVDKLNAGLEKANENLSALQFGPVLERMRTQMEQLASTWDGTQSGLLAKQISIAQASLAETQKNSKEYLSIQQDIARMEVQLKSQAGQEAIAAARANIAAIGSVERTSALQRLTQEKEVWSELIAGDQLTAAQRVEVQRSLNAAISAAERERVSQATQIARQDVDTDIQISRMKVEAEKENIQAVEAADAGAAARKLERLRTLTAQEFALNEQALNAELQTLNAGDADYDRVYNQIRELKAKLVLDLSKLDVQYQQDLKRNLKEESAAWKSTVGEIENAESTLVGDIINKRKSLSQSLRAIGIQMVQQEIANDLKAYTTKLLLQNSAKALEQGGLLFHLTAQTQAAGATATSQSAQTAAVIAGNTARTSATISGAAASKAAEGASGGSMVLADAAKAFSGTYASVAQIPYVGWILAPVAAGAAYAAVAAYEGLASLDTGTMNVPQDMVAQLHQGEAVIPKPFAESMRAGQGIGGGGGGGNSSVMNFNHTISTLDAKSFAALINSPTHNAALGKAVAKYMRRGGR